MIELIAEHGVFRTEQRLKDTRVSVKTAVREESGKMGGGSGERRGWTWWKGVWRECRNETIKGKMSSFTLNPYLA